MRHNLYPPKRKRGRPWCAAPRSTSCCSQEISDFETTTTKQKRRREEKKTAKRINNCRPVFAVHQRACTCGWMDMEILLTAVGAAAAVLGKDKRFFFFLFIIATPCRWLVISLYLTVASISAAIFQSLSIIRPSCPVRRHIVAANDNNKKSINRPM